MSLNRPMAATVLAGLGAQAALADTVNSATGCAAGVVEFCERMIEVFEERMGHDVVLTTMPSSTSDQFAQ